ncbi:hypothetical protein C8Q79DRAFT_913020 [Trametes meyenii]|nr:hypothetical protein C8Q79DRAFT_913020 [Trametes meyenii]
MKPVKKFRFRPRTIPCPFASEGCTRLFSDHSGLTRHVNATHRPPPPSASGHPQRHTAVSTGPDSSGDVAPSFASTWEPSLELDPTTSTPRNPELAPSPTDPATSASHGTDSQLDGSNPEPMITGAPRVEYHPFLNGRPCDRDGNFLPPNTPPSLLPSTQEDIQGHSPFDSRTQFEIADFLYRRAQMSGSKIDELMELWACTLPEGQDPPFASHEHLYATLDAIKQGDVPWQTFSVSYNGPIPEGAMPSWMVREYDVWFRDPRLVLREQYSNPDFANDIDWAPKRLLLPNGKRQYRDFMSGDWAWNEADLIAKDPNMHSATLCTAIAASDKTTVSVATGQNEYYPLYLTNGGVNNSTRWSHRNAISLVGFLAIPKTERHYQNDALFRKFHRELYHTSLRAIFDPLRTSMTTYEVLRCADGHYRRIVFSLGPYIADYPEQVILACTVQGWCTRCTAPHDDLDTGTAPRRSHEHTDALREAYSKQTLWNDYGVVEDLTPFTAYFPRADIHELLSPDLLHQVIKGTFKDHLVTWVEEYLVAKHGKAGAAVIMADIDRRIAAVPGFPGLRRFPEGRGFKQWTGDDSKALMKVYLPAIAGHVPPQMVRAFSAFLEFCYLVRRDTLDDDTLDEIDSALERFHRERSIFITTGVRETISLPRQHSLKHYRRLICLFASPNGLCSSMMEARHITAVKKPYRRTSRNQALGQIILINQRLDKLAALRVHLAATSLLNGPCPRLPRFVQDAANDEVLAPLQGCVREAAGHRRLAPGVDELSSSDSDSDEHSTSTTWGVRVDNHQDHRPEDSTPSEDDEDENIELSDPPVMAECVLSKTPVRGYPKNVHSLAHVLDIPALPDLIRRFLYDQLTPMHLRPDAGDISLNMCPHFNSSVTVFPSAIATYYAPSDPSGPRGMRREWIRSVASWRGGGPRRDCVFVAQDSTQLGFRGLLVARVRLFFSFRFQGVVYPCALVSWFSAIEDEPDRDTGMWVVTPDIDEEQRPCMDIIHLDSIVRGAHLIGVVSEDSFLPYEVRPTHSLDIFQKFFVNKYIDHHAHEIAF